MSQDQASPEHRRQLYLSEAIGTALLVLGGLSVVIFMFGAGSPMERLLPSVVLRRMVTGFLFGCVGGSIALSQVGKVSGAHINPAVTLGFWLMQRLDARTAIGYVCAQLVGAALGSLPLLAWGAMGRSVDFGATVPGEGYMTMEVLLGEVVTTFALVAGLCIFIGFRGLRRFTPFLMPPLYAVMVTLETALSGTSTNPAHVRAGAHLRPLGRLVDLLGWSTGGRARRDCGVQLTRAANRGREALSLRERSPAHLSSDGRLSMIESCSGGSSDPPCRI